MKFMFFIYPEIIVPPALTFLETFSVLTLSEILQLQYIGPSNHNLKII